MTQFSATHSTGSEQAELELVLGALARTPRLADTLKYLADRYFQGRHDEINEYNIATEVYGRSKATFDASRDSIARVEAYRLRKRLKQYYETEGKEHEIHISLPRGSYIPSFTRQAATSPQEVSTAEPPLAIDSFEHSLPPLKRDSESIQGPAEKDAITSNPRDWRVFSKKTLLYASLAVAVLLLLGFGVDRFLGRKSSHPQDAVVSRSLVPTQPFPPNAAQVPLRLLAGYNGSPRIDSMGAYWLADRYFHGGAAFHRPHISIARTSDPMLFDYWRTGDFTYDIPLAPGPYELHLFFVASPQDDSATYFHISANGQPLVKPFNILADALGANIADERIFRDVYPDKDGYLHLAFSRELAEPSINAIEILPGLHHRQLPVRIVMQRTAVTDHNGNLWHPDEYFQGGMPSDLPQQVSGTPDPNLFAQERYGHFTYSIPVDTRDRYTLVLHFAELFWGPQTSGSGGVGSRVFRVYCNGSTLLDNFDIYKEAGSLHALTKTFYHLQASPEGKLDLTFEPLENAATISAIEVIDESQ